MLRQISKILQSDPYGWKITYRKDGYPETMRYGDIHLHLHFNTTILSGYQSLKAVAVYKPFFYQFNWWELFRFKLMMRNFNTAMLQNILCGMDRKLLQQRQQEIDALVAEEDNIVNAQFEELERKEAIRRKQVIQNPLGVGIARGIRKLLG